ncbi:TPA: hypothetical protein NJ652_004661 [Vibrio parahaemolyticus]|nr:hypothetical protein [Vibrio parahaemolyticus]
MLEELKFLWSRYSNEEYSDIKGLKLRLASNRAQARYFVNPPSKPVGEVRMLSNIDINYGWQCQINAEWVKELDLAQNSISLRELQLRALQETYYDADFPYLWWFHRDKTPKKRTVYEDSLGVSFIKLDNVWQVVYSCKKLGSLVGNQGQGGYEDIPPNAYFVIIENGWIADHHSIG